MSDWMRDPNGAAGSTADAAASDYRIRETEARLDRRLASVEARQARTTWSTRLGGIGFLMSLGTLAIVVSAVAPAPGTRTAERLSAEEIVLRDAEGVARGRLGTDAEGRAQLVLSDRDGRERIRLTVLADGSPGVTISDADARPRAVLGHLPDGTTNLVFADAHGVSRAVVGLDGDGSTQALFADRSGAIRTLVGVAADGAPSVTTFDAGTEHEAPPTP